MGCSHSKLLKECRKMGCSHPKLIKIRSKLIEREATVVSECRARKRSMKQFVKSRNNFADAHSMYLKSLRNTGSAFLQLATAEIQTTPHPPPPPPMPSAPPPVSPTSWTAASSTFRPPPPPIPDESFDYFTPVYPGVSLDEECKETTTTTDGARIETEPPFVATTSSSYVSTEGEDLVEITKELNDYFCKASNAGEDYIDCMDTGGKSMHRSTVGNLYKLEKKLYKEVKNAENLRLRFEKKTATIRKLEIKNADPNRSDKVKREVVGLNSLMEVASQEIETTTSKIIKLRDSELHPQLLDLLKRLMSMWRSMYESHQAQMQIVQQLKYLNLKSEILRQSTVQLELEAQQWQIRFRNLVKAQHDYIQSITVWFSGTFLQIGNEPLHGTPFYLLCKKWQRAINRAPVKEASEGMNSFLTMIHAIGVQQAKEQKQKNISELALKELEKKVEDLILVEHEHGPSMREERAKVDTLKAKSNDEKDNYAKSVRKTREMTIDNLHMGLTHVFQAMTNFAKKYARLLEKVANSNDVRM